MATVMWSEELRFAMGGMTTVMWSDEAQRTRAAYSDRKRWMATWQRRIVKGPSYY
jgi:hypothetical protein